MVADVPPDVLREYPAELYSARRGLIFSSAW